LLTGVVAGNEAGGEQGTADSLKPDSEQRFFDQDIE
jgi:hypothetical protein